MLMLPNPNNLIVTIDGRVYSGEANTVYPNVPVQDAQELSANGWIPIPSFTIPHGELYATNVEIPVIVSQANTPYEVTSGFFAGSLNGFTFTNNRVKAKVPGRYLISWSMSPDTVFANDTIEGGVTLNGVAQENATSHMTVAVTALAGAIASSGIFRMEADDEAGLYVRVHNVAHNVTVQHASLAAVMIGEY